MAENILDASEVFLTKARASGTSTYISGQRRIMDKVLFVVGVMQATFEQTNISRFPIKESVPANVITLAARRTTPPDIA